MKKGDILKGLEITIIVSGYILVSIVGIYFIKLILRKYEEEIKDSGLKKAGMMIGIAERIITFTLALLNQYAAISIIFAAKSIARFNELKDRKIAEYYLIGTLYSISFALIAGLIIRHIVGDIA